MAVQDFLDDLYYSKHSSYGLQCPTCGTQLPKLSLRSDFYRTRNESCSCEGILYYRHYQPFLMPEYNVLNEDKEAKNAVFYHATTRHHWYDQLPEKYLAHFGSKRAAYERTRNMNEFEKNITVYAIQFNEDAAIHSELLLDDMCNATVGDNLPAIVPETVVEIRFAGIKENAVRYMNVYEAPGSLCFAASKKTFHVVEELSFREAFNKEPIYPTSLVT